MNVRNTKGGDTTDEQGSNDTTNGDGQPFAIDGRKHLTGYDTSDDTPTYLQDDVEKAGDL